MRLSIAPGCFKKEHRKTVARVPAARALASLTPPTSAWPANSSKDARLLLQVGADWRCYDNCVIESCWGKLPSELVNTNAWRTHLEQFDAKIEYVEGRRNLRRRLDMLGMRHLVGYEKIHLNQNCHARNSWNRTWERSEHVKAPNKSKAAQAVSPNRSETMEPAGRLR